MVLEITGPGFRQAHKCGRITGKPVNGIPTLLS